LKKRRRASKPRCATTASLFPIYRRPNAPGLGTDTEADKTSSAVRCRERPGQAPAGALGRRIAEGWAFVDKPEVLGAGFAQSRLCFIPDWGQGARWEAGP